MTDTTATATMRIHAGTQASGLVRLTLGDSTKTIRTESLEAARVAILDFVRQEAADRESPIELETREPDGTWLLLVHPDGHVQDITPAPAETRPAASTRPDRRNRARTAAPAAAQHHKNADPSEHRNDAQPEEQGQGEGKIPESDPTKLTEEERRALLEKPAEWGFRGWTNHNLPGTRGPSQRECDYRIRVATEAKRREHRKALVNANINRTKGYCAFVVVQSEKGGVGKSTVSALVGYYISKLRQEAVLLVDLNPDKTNLHVKLDVKPTHSLLDLVLAKDSIPSRHQAKEFMTKVPGRNIYYLANEIDPASREQTRTDNVLTMRDIVKPFFSIGVLDNGTGSRHPAMEGSIRIGHSSLFVMENTRDFDEFAQSTLTRLETSNEDLRNRVVVVINTRVQPPIKPAPLTRDAEPDEKERHARMMRAYEGALKNYVDPYKLAARYAGFVRAAVVLPYDQALANSGAIDFDAVLPETEEAGEELARLAIEDLSEEARTTN